MDTECNADIIALLRQVLNKKQLNYQAAIQNGAYFWQIKEYKCVSAISIN
ncbi:hypothetical protein [Niastella caeni]|nr:hypothetical protein [Niastella caeni]